MVPRPYFPGVTSAMQQFNMRNGVVYNKLLIIDLWSCDRYFPFWSNEPLISGKAIIGIFLHYVLISSSQQHLITRFNLGLSVHLR